MKRPITPRGNDLLIRELKRLKALRPELSRAIEIARGHGDLSENGDYDAAKERSGMTEAKIRDLEGKLSWAEIIDPRKFKDPTKVVFGVSVKLAEVETGEERLYEIVGADESDIDKGWLSIESPLAKALLGKEVGDTLKAGGAGKEYEVLEIFIGYQDLPEEEVSDL